MTRALAASLARLPVTLADIEAAAGVLAGFVKRTNFDHSRTLSGITGAGVWLKFENLQFTATFKERGALNRLSALSAEERGRGVIACSAGNHAQGVAYHAARLNIPATIVVPVGTPTVKIENTRRHGASVIEGGATLEEAAQLAIDHGRKQRLTFIHPYDDPLIIAGQGTVALEMLAAVPDLDVLLVPIGGGGLISGMAVAAKTLKPSIEIIGVQAALYPSMYNLIKGLRLPMRGDTLAEGIAVKAPGRITSEIVRALVDDIVLVSERQIEQALSLLITIEKTVTEGAGAAGLAAILANAGTLPGPRGRPRAQRRQYRHPAVVRRADPPTRARRPLVATAVRHRGPARSTRDRGGRAEQDRRQHRRGVASAHLHRPAGQGGAARGRDRDPRPEPSRLDDCRAAGGQHRCRGRRALTRAATALPARPVRPWAYFEALAILCPKWPVS